MTSATSRAATSASVLAPRAQLHADSLVEGILLLLVVTIAPRAIGFTRGILFCRWLSPDELGRWELAHSFLLLAAPLAVLGLPGSFGRYAEKYRQQGQLRTFLKRLTAATIILAAVGTAIIALGSDRVAGLVFGDTSLSGVVRLLAVVLLVTVAFNFLVSLFSALRQMRVVTVMQLVHSVAFASFGLALISCWQASAEAVIVAFALASTIAALIAGMSLWRVWRTAPGDTAELSHQTLWSKLLPFALWIWTTNLLANLFAIADRYMIVHFSTHDAAAAAATIGNYHSGQIIPALLVSVSVMLSTVITPHLSHDWEQGRRSAVSNRLNLVMKCWSLVLMAAATCVLIGAPLLFQHIFAGKYEAGQQIQPWTLLCSIWFGLCLIVQTYLWCAEKAPLVSVTYAAGLIVNICLNFMLLPRLGLLGAVIATTVSTGIALALVSCFSRGSGMSISAGCCAGALLPLALCLGPIWAVAALVGFCAMIPLGSWFFDEHEKRLLVDGIKQQLRKLRFV